MQDKRNRRPRGTGSVLEKHGAWYGKWRVDERQVMRKLGPVRTAHTSDGLTRAMAEKRLRALMLDATPSEPVRERYTVEEVGRRHLARLRRDGRRENTLESYESFLRVHLSPYFQSRPIGAISRAQIEQLVDQLLAGGAAPKSVRNYLGLLHGIFEFALREGWVSTNPCKLVSKPRDPEHNEEVHFLDPSEVEALCRAVPDDPLGRVEAVLYRTAAMTGLRQGELLALRWQDVDWLARKVRVRLSRSRGRLGPTKSKRSSRAVPLADSLAGELERHFQRVAWQADGDLVFAHPDTGGPIDRSKLRKRYVAAIARAKVRPITFHDLRHTFGTRMAAANVPMRTLQEWMGHRDIKTTQIYADYAPAKDEPDLVDAAFATDTNTDTKLPETENNSETENAAETGELE